MQFLKKILISSIALAALIWLAWSVSHAGFISNNLKYTLNYESVKEELEQTGYDLKRHGVKLALVRWREATRCTKAFEYLLQNGLDASGTDKNGNSLLMYACGLRPNRYPDSYEYFNLLIKYGANVHAKNKEGFTALDYAARSGDMRKVLRLEELGAIPSNVTLNMSQPEEGDEERDYSQYEVSRHILLYLTEHQQEYDLDPVVAAALLGEEDKLMHLLKESDSVSSGAAVCIYAFGTPKILEFLIQEKVFPLDDPYPAYYLDICAYYCNFENCKYLIEHYSIDPIGVFPAALHEALLQGNLEIAELLLENGAALGEYTIYTADDTFRDMAHGGSKEGARFMLDHGYILSDSMAAAVLEIAAANGDVEFLQFLLDQGVDINTGYLDDMTTALSAASLDGNLELVKWLCEHGARSDGSKSPLRCAAEEGHLDVVKYLFEEQGADINGYTVYRDGSGGSALQSAIDYGYLDVVQYLVENGADTEHTWWHYNRETGEKRDVSALEIAGYSESKHIREYLQGAVSSQE